MCVLFVHMPVIMLVVMVWVFVVRVPGMRMCLVRMIGGFRRSVGCNYIDFCARYAPAHYLAHLKARTHVQSFSRLCEQLKGNTRIH